MKKRILKKKILADDFWRVALLTIAKEKYKMSNPLLEDKIPDDILSTSTDRNEIETINYLIEKNIGVQRWKFLKENGAIIVKSNTVITNFKDYLDPSKFEQYDIITRKGEYISRLNLPQKSQTLVKLIYKHRIGKLMNYRTAVGLPLAGVYGKSINMVNIGYSEKEKAWFAINTYGKTYIKTYIGCVLDKKTNKIAETDEECKMAAVSIVCYFESLFKKSGARGQ